MQCVERWPDSKHEEALKRYYDNPGMSWMFALYKGKDALDDIRHYFIHHSMIFCVDLNDLELIQARINLAKKGEGKR